MMHAAQRLASALLGLVLATLLDPDEESWMDYVRDMKRSLKRVWHKTRKSLLA